MPQDHPENSSADRPAPPPPEQHPPPKSHRLRWIIIGVVALLVIGLGLFFGRHWIHRYFTTVSTDDAYVSSHVSYISARVSGNVLKIFVDDNQRVKQGTLLLEIDHQPYQIAVDQKRAALHVAEANWTVVLAQARGQEAAARAGWYSLVNAQEQVRYQVATLHSNVTNLKLQEANLELARKETARVRRLVSKEAATKEELDERVADEEVARQRVLDARDTIRRTRAALGLPANEEHPTEIPENLEQNFSAVQTALSNAVQPLMQIGVPIKLHGLTPDRLRQELTNGDSAGSVSQTLDRLVERAPTVIQARAVLDQAREDLRNAELNLRYTYVYAPIDGQVFRRSVNFGNNVTTGQSLMAVRSEASLWIDANFKETQLDYIRIGQPVDVYVDAYPHKVFRGRVEGFNAGTGSSIALIPPENATGNFVKIVQRLPVRITLHPDDLSKDTPLFIGLSVEPYVKYKEPPTGPNAGQRLLEPKPPAESYPPSPVPNPPIDTRPWEERLGLPNPPLGEASSPASRGEAPQR